MTLFYTPDISEEKCILPEDEAKHAIRVLRLSEGDSMLLTDGKGYRYKGVLASADVGNCVVDIVQKLPTQSSRGYGLHIAIAPTKSNSRLEWFLEKSCEIGIDVITPIICDHSERRKLQSSRLSKILVGAMKQSNRDLLPLLNPITSFGEFLNKSNLDSESTFMASYNEDNQDIAELVSPGQDVVVMIGPEGDFSEMEIQKASDKGIGTVNLGTTRLRTETAGIVAVHTVALINSVSINK